MPKSRRRKQRPSQKKSQPNNSLPTIRAIGIDRPMDVLMYRPGRCALCECKATDPMPGITWQGQAIADPLACHLCVRCALKWMTQMTEQQRIDFMLAAEMDMACEIAGENLDRLGVSR